jgi:hypothetical protein
MGLYGVEQNRDDDRVILRHSTMNTLIQARRLVAMIAHVRPLPTNHVRGRSRFVDTTAIWEQVAEAIF